MPTTISTDGQDGVADAASRLCQVSNRSNVMIIDATLRAVAGPCPGSLDAAAEVRALARRVQQTMMDFTAALEPVR
jgi:hypothetical protein